MSGLGYGDLNKGVPKKYNAAEYRLPNTTHKLPAVSPEQRAAVNAVPLATRGYTGPSPLNQQGRAPRQNYGALAAGRPQGQRKSRRASRKNRRASRKNRRASRKNRR